MYAQAYLDGRAMPCSTYHHPIAWAEIPKFDLAYFRAVYHGKSQILGLSTEQWSFNFSDITYRVFVREPPSPGLIVRLIGSARGGTARADFIETTIGPINPSRFVPVDCNSSVPRKVLQRNLKRSYIELIFPFLKNN